MNLDSQTVHLIDTPGFDDTDVSDTDVLDQIAEWLVATSLNNLKLSGLIYLHRITDDRIGGCASRNLAMLEKLCGSDNMHNVVLVTSRWEEIENEKGVKRERELTGEGGFWHGMINNGATTHCYNGTKDGATDIVRMIMHKAPIYLQLQKEMDEGKPLAETAAGKAIIANIEREETRTEKELQRLLKEMKQREEKNAALLEEQNTKMQNLVNSVEKDRKEMDELRQRKQELQKMADEMKLALVTAKKNAALLEEQKKHMEDMRENSAQARKAMEDLISKQAEHNRDMQKLLERERQDRQDMEDVRRREAELASETTKQREAEIQSLKKQMAEGARREAAMLAEQKKSIKRLTNSTQRGRKKMKTLFEADLKTITQKLEDQLEQAYEEREQAREEKEAMEAEMNDMKRKIKNLQDSDCVVM